MHTENLAVMIEFRRFRKAISDFLHFLISWLHSIPVRTSWLHIAPIKDKDKLKKKQKQKNSEIITDDWHMDLISKSKQQPITARRWFD